MKSVVKRLFMKIGVGVGVVGALAVGATVEASGDDPPNPGSVRAARIQLASLAANRDFDIEGTTALIVPGQDAIQYLAGTCPSSGTVPFDIFGYPLDDLIHEQLSVAGAKAITLDTKERVLYFSWEGNADLENLTGTHHAMLTLLPSTLCGIGAGAGANKTGNRRGDCGVCPVGEINDCAVCAVSHPSLPHDGDMLVDLDDYSVLPDWSEAPVPGSVRSARIQLESLETNRGFELKDTVPTIIGGASAISTLADLCPGSGSAPFDIFGPDIDPLIYEHLSVSGAKAISLNTADPVLYLSWENNPGLRLRTGSDHAMLTLLSSTLCGIGAGGGVNKTGNRKGDCGTCPVGEINDCAVCAVSHPIETADEVRIVNFDDDSPLPNWSH